MVLVTYSNFDDISSNQIQLLQSSKNSSKLSSRPSSRFRGSSRRSKSRIKSINIDRQIHGPLGSNSVDNSLDDSIGTNGIDLARFDNFEAAVTIVVVIARSAQRCSNTSVDVAVIGEQALLRGVVKVSAVVYGRNF